MATVGTLNFPSLAPLRTRLGGSSEATLQPVDRFVPSQTEDLSFLQMRSPARQLAQAASGLADFGLDIPELDSPNSLQAYRQRQKHGKLNSPTDIHLPSQAAPALQRPVLLIHGFTSGPETWKTMRTWLTSTSANGDGGIVDSNSPSVDPQAKVFLIKFSRPYNSIRTNATELRQVIDKICSATGSHEIDLVGHSMGGLNARYYLQQGEEKVKNLVMIATPNHGSLLSDSELKFRERGLPLVPRVDDEEVRRCQRDLCEDKVKDGKQNNPTLHDLNKDWETQTARANMLLIAGNGTPTLQSRTALTVWGDGAVTQNSVKMDKVPLKNIWRADHNGVKEHPEALMATADFLTGQSPHPPRAPQASGDL